MSAEFDKAAVDAAKLVNTAAATGNTGNAALAAAILAHAYALRDLSASVRWRRG